MFSIYTYLKKKRTIVLERREETVTVVLLRAVNKILETGRRLVEHAILVRF